MDEEEPNDEGSEDDDSLKYCSAAWDEAKFGSIPARRNPARGVKLDSDVDDRTEGGRHKKSLRNLDEDDEELDDRDIKDNDGLNDKVKTAPVLFAGTPPPKCRRRCLAQQRCLVRPPVAKPREKPDRA